MTILFINNYGPNPATLTGKDFSIYYLWGRPLQTTLCCTELYPRFIFIFYAISGKKTISSVFDSKFKEVDLWGRPLSAAESHSVASYGQILVRSLEDTQIMHNVCPNAGMPIQIWIWIPNLGLHSELGDTF
jgi:hypothetical protein